MTQFDWLLFVMNAICFAFAAHTHFTLRDLEKRAKRRD